MGSNHIRLGTFGAIESKGRRPLKTNGSAAGRGNRADVKIIPQVEGGIGRFGNYHQGQRLHHRGKNGVATTIHISNIYPIIACTEFAQGVAVDKVIPIGAELIRRNSPHPLHPNLAFWHTKTEQIQYIHQVHGNIGRFGNECAAEDGTGIGVGHRHGIITLGQVIRFSGCLAITPQILVSRHPA